MLISPRCYWSFSERMLFVSDAAEQPGAVIDHPRRYQETFRKRCSSSRRQRYWIFKARLQYVVHTDRSINSLFECLRYFAYFHTIYTDGLLFSIVCIIWFSGSEPENWNYTSGNQLSYFATQSIWQIQPSLYIIMAMRPMAPAAISLKRTDILCLDNP